MCGRMTMTREDLAEVAEELAAVVDPALLVQYRPRFNVAPSDTHVVMQRHEVKGGAGGPGRRLVAARWGLPRRDGSPGAPHINARAETAPFKSSFRDAFVGCRCVVLADGFYEWKKDGGRKQPYWYHRADGGLMLMAGLMDEGTPGEPPRFLVLTTAPNALVSVVHDRMPAILERAEADRWLAGPDRSVLHPARDGVLVATPVSSRVSSVKNDDPGCLEPVDPDDPRSGGPGGQMSLF